MRFFHTLLGAAIITVVAMFVVGVLLLHARQVCAAAVRRWAAATRSWNSRDSARAFWEGRTGDEWAAYHDGIEPRD